MEKYSKTIQAIMMQKPVKLDVNSAKSIKKEKFSSLKKKIF